MSKDKMDRSERRKFDRGVISGNKNQNSSEFLDFDKLKSVISGANKPKTGIDMWFQQQKQQEAERVRRVEEARKNRN